MPWFTKKERRMQVSAFPAIFKAGFDRFPTCIGRRSIRPEMADTARFWPNQPGSMRIEIDSARIESHQRESSRVGANSRKKKKKKNADAVRRAGNRVGGRVPRRVPCCAASDVGATPLVSRPCFLASPPLCAAFLLPFAYSSIPSWVHCKYSPKYKGIKNSKLVWFLHLLVG